jgi:hypothetical protein
MEIQPDEVDVYGTGRNTQWFASEGLSENGHKVVINYLVRDEAEVNALAHGLGISHNVSMHTKAEHIGTVVDFNDATETPPDR